MTRLAGPYSRRLTILEGPDGSGKSTVGQELARRTHAHYVHCGPFLSLDNPADLARMYVEAMMPAVLGHRDVVMDRCWLSEWPYGQAHRNKVRLRDADRAMLERLALRCATVLVVARPPWEVVKSNWERRKGRELLETDLQLKAVYDWYQLRLSQVTNLPYVGFDYTTGQAPSGDLDWRRTRSHPVGFATCGNLEAKVAMVGEAFGNIKPGDPGYQWCFASFSKQGCSQWLAEQLVGAGISERELVWINADQPGAQLSALIDASPRKLYVALGAQAEEALRGRPNVLVERHPQFHKRFRAGEPYPTLTTIKEAIQ